MTSIELEVNLTAPGMEFVDGSNMATIELDKGQDSTVAQFHLRVRAGTPAGAAEADGYVLVQPWVCCAGGAERGD
jgi:hypothetical protein